MAKRSVKDEAGQAKVDLSESSVYGDSAEGEEEEFAAEDVATNVTIDRLEEIVGGTDDEAEMLATGRLGRQMDALNASADEEIDALQLDLAQVDDLRTSTHGSGPIVDDVAEERLAEFTEVGRDLDEEGALEVVPGLDDTSQVLRHRHPNAEFARADAVVEGNLDEPRDEEAEERKVDEGTAG